MPIMKSFDPFAANPDHPLRDSQPDYGAWSSTPRMSPIGTKSSPSPVQLTFRDRRNKLQESEREKDNLIDDLLYQLEAAEAELRQLRKAKANGCHSENTIAVSPCQLASLDKVVDRASYISVLIDGEQFVCHSYLFNKGAGGGQAAAHHLRKSILRVLAKTMPEVTVPRIVVRIYADFEKVTEGLLRTGYLAEAHKFDDFVRGFNGFDPLYEYVDTGPTKNGTRDMIRDFVVNELDNIHCCHIILGIPDDGEYREIHQEIDARPSPPVLVTMLDHRYQLIDMKQNQKDWSFRFGVLFGNTRITDSSTATGTSSSSTEDSPVLKRVESSSDASFKTPPTSPVSTHVMSWAGMAAMPVVATAKPSSTKATTAVSKSVVRVNKPANVNGVKLVGAKVIDRNRLGQRIDKHDSGIPHNDITRVKKLKLCNAYYLQGPSACTSASCAHTHKAAITNFDRKVLREVTRLTPCRNKTECMDVDCIYGHHCPRHKLSENECYYGKDCHFAGWGHAIDLEIVRTTRI